MILLPGCRCCDSDCDPVWSGDWGCGVGAVDLLEKVTVDWSAAQFERIPDFADGSYAPWPGDGQALSLEIQEIYFPKQYDSLQIAQADRAYWKHVEIASGENPDIPVSGWGPDGVTLQWTNQQSFVDIDCVGNKLGFECRNNWAVEPMPDVLTSQKYFLDSFDCGGVVEFFLNSFQNNFRLYLDDAQEQAFLAGEEVLPTVDGRCFLEFQASDCGQMFPETAFYNFYTYRTPNTLDGQTQRPQMKMDC